MKLAATACIVMGLVAAIGTPWGWLLFATGLVLFLVARQEEEDAKRRR